MSTNTKIAATLRYGKYYRTNIAHICYLLLCSVLVACAFILWNQPPAIPLLIIGGVTWVLALALLVVNLHVKKCVKKWMDDAVKLKATTENGVDSFLESAYSPFVGRSIKLTFIFNKKKYIKVSKTNIFNGTSWAFCKYIGREIDILYSPKYDEVMIVKD